MRGDDSSYRRRPTFEPRASIVDLPNPAPLGKGPAGGNRSRLIVALLGAFVIVALLKPWEALRDQASAPAPLPSVHASAPAPSTGPVTGEGGLGAGLDWSVAGPVVARHDVWGVRALVLESGAAAGAVSTSTSSNLGNLHAAEVWTAATPTDIGARAPEPSAPGEIVSDATLVRTQGAPVAAIGVTSPDAQPVIDVRLWRIVGGQATRVDAVDLPGTAPGIDRLLVPPPDLDPSGLWPPGVYHLDLLVRQKVLGLTLLLPRLPHDPAQIARITELAGALPPGPFMVTRATPASGRDYVVSVIPTSPLQRLGEAAAWLQLAGRSPIDGAPDAATIAADSSIVALGLRGRPGEQLASTIMVNLAPATPHTRPGLVVASETSDIVIYDLGTDGLPPGVYQIETTWFNGPSHVARSLYLDVRGPGPARDAPFLLAARQWAGFSGQSVVLATGAAPIAQIPDRVPPDASRLGPTCAGGALLDDHQKVIGLGYAGGSPRSIKVDRLYTAAGRTPVAAAIAADTVPGLILMADTASQTWRPGYYEISLARNGGTDTIVFCVGSRDATGALAVPAGADSPPGSGSIVKP
jgi:hypothetical protein